MTGIVRHVQRRLTMSNNEIDSNDVDSFSSFLQGTESKLKLTATEAFSVIYYLQEHLKVIPTSFEKCEHCNVIFDTDESGHVISDEDDTWYKDCGFTPEDIAPHEGKCFCDNQCEYRYLLKAADNG